MSNAGTRNTLNTHDADYVERALKRYERQVDFVRVALNTTRGIWVTASREETWKRFKPTEQAHIREMSERFNAKFTWGKVNGKSQDAAR